MLTTIANQDAPSQYTYDVTAELGQRLELADGGGAVIVNTDETIAAVVAPAWAKDANGKDIPTRYEIDGNRLIQNVEHVNINTVAYPVVADPIWLAPWVVRCLMALGLSGPQITRIAQGGSPGAILAAGGFAALRCVLGR